MILSIVKLTVQSVVKVALKSFGIGKERMSLSTLHIISMKRILLLCVGWLSIGVLVGINLSI